MSLISPVFLLFLLTLIIVYYCCPAKYRWQILLLASLVFYCWGGEYQALFIFVNDSIYDMLCSSLLLVEISSIYQHIFS